MSQKLIEIIEAAFLAGRSKTSWEQFKMDNPNLEDSVSIGCECSNDIKHGETSIMCCNHCGKPTEEFWTRNNK